MRSNILPMNCRQTDYKILTTTPLSSCKFEICVNGVKIQQTDSIKHLGVIIDNNLSWKPQICSICGKLSQASCVEVKLRHFSDMNLLRLIYFSLFHSHL